MIKRAFCILLGVLCISPLLFAEKRTETVYDNHGFCSVRTHFYLDATYNVNVVDYIETPDGPYVAEAEYGRSDFNYPHQDSHYKRRVTGQMKDGFRHGRWTTYGNNTAVDSYENWSRHEEFSGSGTYNNGVPDGEWQLSFSGIQGAMCTCTVVIKDTVLRSVNYTGFNPINEYSYPNNEKIIVKGACDEQGLMDGKWDILRDEYILQREYSHGHLLSEKKGARDKGTLIYDSIFNQELYSADESLIRSDDQLSTLCLYHFGGDVFQDYPSTPSVLDHGLWCVASIGGTKESHDKIIGFRYYARKKRNTITIQDYIQSHVSNAYSTACPASMDDKACLERYQTMLAEISEKNIPFLDSLAIQLARAPKTSDQQYYIFDDQLISCVDSASIDDARRHQVELQEQLQALVSLSTRLLDLQAQKQTVLDQMPQYVYLLGTLADMQNHEVIEQIISVSTNLLPIQQEIDLLSPQLAQAKGVTPEASEYNRLLSDHALYLLIDSMYIQELQNREALSALEMEQQTYNQLINSVRVESHPAEYIRTVFVVQKRIPEYVGLVQEHRALAQQIAETGAKYEHVLAAYALVCEPVVLTWKSDWQPELQDLIQFDKAVLQCLQNNARKTNRQLKKQEDITVIKTIVFEMSGTH
ncbi:MAG: hypothetical protein II540_06770 [Paludibacteraceae bacterium]|nr:hypothetical protein [Paludibacteraceae bacterium]